MSHDIHIHKTVCIWRKDLIVCIHSRLHDQWIHVHQKQNYSLLLCLYSSVGLTGMLSDRSCQSRCLLQISYDRGLYEEEIDNWKLMNSSWSVTQSRRGVCCGSPHSLLLSIALHGPCTVCPVSEAVVSRMAVAGHYSVVPGQSVRYVGL